MKKKIYYAMFFNKGSYTIAHAKKQDWANTRLNGKRYYPKGVEKNIIPVHLTPIPTKKRI